MVEDQGKKLRDVLISRDSFKQAYLVGGGQRDDVPGLVSHTHQLLPLEMVLQCRTLYIWTQVETQTPLYRPQYIAIHCLSDGKGLVFPKTTVP